MEKKGVGRNLYELISLQLLKMMSRWVIGMVMVCMLLVAAAASDDAADAVEEKEPVADTESARTGRQYHSRRPSLLGRNPSHLLDYSKQDESFVQYDPSGLGFEIQKPGVFQYQFRPAYHSEPARPAAGPIKPPVQPKTAYREKPSAYVPYSPETAYPPRPAYHEAVKPPPHYPGSYKLESLYPESPNQYDDKYPYYCPKVGGYESQCRPAKDCAVWYDLVLITPGSSCKLVDGEPGMCCPDLPYNSE